MRIRITAGGDLPLTVGLEPSGMEYVLQPGDFIDYEWSADSRFPSLIGTIDHEPTRVTIGEGGGPSRLWDSGGVELSSY